MINEFQKAITKVLSKYISFTVTEVPMKNEKDLRGTFRLNFKHYVSNTVRIDLDQISKLHYPALAQDMYLEESVKSLVEKVCGEAIEIADLRENFWQRLRFLFKPI